uniref:Chemokine (C-C motif) ligand 36, duplicate 1 n=1 Tax=Cyprinus carpio TaxID=7962 RepID=A0A8C2DTR9_CYPCA
PKRHCLIIFITAITGANLSPECDFIIYWKIPIATIDFYIETKVDCPKPGVIFVTKRGFRICTHPQLGWVKSAMKAIDDRDL